jgi:histidinol-phosphate aminotransferase
VRAVAPYVPGEQPDPTRRVIKLNTNENPYPPSPRVLDAVMRAADGIRLYPDPEARALRDRAAAVYGVPAAGILVGNGSDELLALLVRALVDPGDRVAYPVPTYSLYDTLVAVQGAEPVHVPFPDDFSLPLGLADAGARLTIVCNPNSPSGTLISTGRIQELARAVRGVLVVDEAYVDFARENAMGLVGRVANIVVLRTFSKSFSLAGMRVGLAFGDPELIAGLRTVKDSYNVGRLAQVAAVAALEDLPAMLGNVERIRRTRASLVSGLTALGFAAPPSEANFVLARRPGVDLGPLAHALAGRDILVRHFATLPDALRITVGTDGEIDMLLAALRDLTGS